MSQECIPLAPGRISLRDQAAQRGLPLVLGSTVAELIAAGYDVDPAWPLHWTLQEWNDSPTGCVVSGTPIPPTWALAT